MTKRRLPKRMEVSRYDLHGGKDGDVTHLVGYPGWAEVDAWPEEIVLGGDADEYGLHWGFGPHCGCHHGERDAPDQVLHLAQVTRHGAGLYVSPDGRCQVGLWPTQMPFTVRVRWPDGAEEDVDVHAVSAKYARQVGRERLAYRAPAGWKTGMREYRPGGRIVSVRSAR